MLIRSDIVAGYPGLRIDGYAGLDQAAPLQLLRMDRLTPNILLCLFHGELARLDSHQEPESLHFAVELPAEGQFGKTLRGPSGDAGPTMTPMPLDPAGRLPIQALAAQMAAARRMTQFGAGDFARQMIETAELVSFLRGPASL